MQVLIVDDSVTARTAVTSAIHKRFPGSTVYGAADGEQAWSTLQDRPMDLLVTDLDMIPLDGVALVQRVRSDARFNHVRVLVHSAHLDIMVRAILGKLPLVELLPKPATDRGIAVVVQSLWQESGGAVAA